MGTLLNGIQTLRESKTSITGHQGLTSILNIDGQLYDIKDPGVEALAEAVEGELSSLIGTQADLSSADSIFGAKKYAEELVNNLAGTNWADNAKKVQEIIEEIENSDNANAWATAIDKLAGLDIKYTQAEADEYNATLTGAISTEISLTAEQATALNGLDGVSSTTYEAGQTPTAEDAALYNASLEGAKSTSSTKTPQTVKQYVDAAVVTAAQDLDDFKNEIEDQHEVVAAALTDLDYRITNLDLSDKANKAAITTATVNNWTSGYQAANETLYWTNTQTTVYVPVSGEDL